MLIITKDGQPRFFETPGNDAVGFVDEKKWIEQDPTIYPNAEAARIASLTKPGPKFWTREDGVVCMGVCYNPDFKVAENDIKKGVECQKH